VFGIGGPECAASLTQGLRQAFGTLQVGAELPQVAQIAGAGGLVHQQARKKFADTLKSVTSGRGTPSQARILLFHGQSGAGKTHLIRLRVLAGLLVAISIGVLALTGGAFGVVEPWPVLLVVGAGLLVGVPRLRHALALVTGITIGAVTVWTSGSLLPDAAVGRAVTYPE
jgi:hypothetical protein